MAETRRFPVMTEQEMNHIIEERDAENTLKSNRNAVRVFEAFLEEESWMFGGDMHSATTWTSAPLEQLATAVKCFYAQARTKDNEYYKKTSMMCLRNGLNRHINQVRRSVGVEAIDLTKNPIFSAANGMFSAMGKVLKKEGKACVEHYEPIATEDLRRLRSYFKENIEHNPKVLQLAVFVNLVIYFGRRGRENIRQLKVSDFAVTTDPEGDLYLYQITDERTKNHQEDGGKKNARMYQCKEDDEMCPVRIFVQYKKKLNPKCIILFQRAKSKITSVDKAWYDNVPMGEHKLGGIMATLSAEAQLSKRYTNHSLRATTVTLLDDARQEGRHIIAITEHASVASLSSYSRTSEKRKKTMSNILSYGLDGNDTFDYTEPPPKRQNEEPKPSNSDQDMRVMRPENFPGQVCVAPVNNAAVCDDLDARFQDFMDMVDVQPLSPSQNIQANYSSNSARYMQPIFNNCTVTINYN